MISVFVRPDKTQILKTKIKNHAIQVKEAKELQSYYACFTSETDAEPIMSGDEILSGGSVEAIESFFRAIKKNVGSSDEIYLVLPDQLFPYIDVEEVTENTTPDSFILSTLQEEPENFSILIPYESSPGQDRKSTIYAMRNNDLNNIIEAANNVEIPLASIEPASIAAVRGMMKFNREHIFFECFPKMPITIYSYSPLGGIFRMETQFTPEQLENLPPDEVYHMINNTLHLRDVNAEEAFSNYNNDLKLTVMYASGKLLRQSGLQSFIAPAFNFSYVTNPEKLGRAEDWLVSVGSHYQKFSDSHEGYTETVPPFLNIKPSNFLPQEIRVNTRVSGWQKSLQSFLTTAMVLLLLICAAEGAGIFYYSSFEVPASTKTEYEEAKKNEANIDKELVVIEQAKLEHEAPYTALKELVASKKDNIHFSRFIVNDSDNNKWINLEAFTADPVMFQDFIGALRVNPTFNNVSLTGISRDEGTGYVRGQFIVGKGAGKEPSKDDKKDKNDKKDDKKPANSKPTQNNQAPNNQPNNQQPNATPQQNQPNNQNPQQAKPNQANPN